jgi:hypothetical protein
MIDYKRRQSERDDDQPTYDSPYKPYTHEHRGPESIDKVADTINTFYKNKKQYEAFVRAVGKDTATRWMAKLIERANEDQ